MATSDEDLVAGHMAYEHEDSERSEEDVMFIEEERIDSDETRNEVNKDGEGVNNLLEGTADTVAEFLPLEKAKSPVWQYFRFPAHSREYVEKTSAVIKKYFANCVKSH